MTDAATACCADCDAETRTTYVKLGPVGPYFRRTPRGWKVVGGVFVCPTCQPTHIPEGAAISAKEGR